MAEDKKGAAQSAPNQDNKGAGENPPSLEEQITTLEQANKTQEKVIVEMQKDMAKLQKELADAKDELKDAAEIIEDLKAQPKGTDKSGKTVTVDGKKYRISGGFRGRDKVYMPEDIAADKKLLKNLIEKKSGLVKEV